MKKILTLTQSVILALQVFGAPVDVNMAKQNACDFYKKKHYNIYSRSLKTPVKAPVLNKVDTFHDNFYVFNVEGGGFVIVAADDAVAPVLGYCDEGSFSEQEIPVGMKAWLEDCNSQIQAVVDGEAEPVLDGMDKDKAPISPLLTTTWGQGSKDGGTGYNTMCPMQESYYSVTGCVATAMAQIMRYHRWPEGATMSIPAYNGGKVGDVTALDPIVFDWNNMLDSYVGTESTGHLNAVAELMRYCGQSVRMQYSYAGSGAYARDVAVAFRTYFGYDQNLCHVLRSDYNLTQWYNLIYDEISEGRPVFLGGLSTSGGHGFVCDGYLSDGFFHINWGWNGSLNGYYLLSLCNPSYDQDATVSSYGYGYSRSQEAIIGIQKPTDIVSPLRLTGSNMAVDSVLSIKYTNKTGSTHTFEYGVAILAENGFEILKQETGEIASGTSVDFSYDYKQSGLAEGSHDIYFVSRLQGFDRWIDSYVTYAVADVNADAANVMPPSSSLTFVKGAISTDGYANEQQEVLISLANDGDGEFSGSVYLYAAMDGLVQPTSSTNYIPVSIPAHSTAEIPMYWKPQTAGVFNIWISTTNSQDHIFGEFQVTIKEALNQDGITLGEVEFLDSESENGIYTVIGPDVTVKVPITNNDANNELVRNFDLALVRQIKPGSSSCQYVWVEKVPVAIPAGETAYLSYDIKGLEPNDSLLYMVRITHNIRENGRHADGKFYNKIGMMTYLADGTSKKVAVCKNLTIAENVSAVDLRGVSGVKNIMPNSNPNTLYLLDEDAEQPKGIEGANVVKGGYAQRIMLADGFNFNSPVDFKAGEIFYTRTLKSSCQKGILYGDAKDSGNNGEAGWETVILPFAAHTANRSNGICYAAGSETGNGVAIMKLANIDSDEIFYEDVSRMEANTPYVIAVPGNLTENEEIIFSSTDVEIHADNTISMVCEGGEFFGSMQSDVQSFVYVFDESSRCFELSSSETEILPFRVYVKKSQTDATPETLALSSFSSSDAEEKPDDTTVYEATLLNNDDSAEDGHKNTDVIRSMMNDGKVYDVTLQDRKLYKDGDWNTLCLPFAVESFEGTPLEGATVKALVSTASSLDAHGVLTLGFQNVDRVEAGFPYIVKWETPGETIQNPVFKGVEITVEEPVSVNFRNDRGLDCQFVGQFSVFGITESNIDEIVMLGSNSQLGYSQNPRLLRAFLCHFVIPVINSANGVRAYSVDFGDGYVTGILETANSKQTTSRSVDGQFDLQGVRVDKASRRNGTVYIENGRKFVRK